MEKENIRSRISSLLHLNATKVVHVTYTSDAFNNKADGSQNFSSADILSSVQGKLTSYDAAHSNNVDSVRRNQFSSHAAITNGINSTGVSGSWEHNHMKNQSVMTPYHAPHSFPATTPRPICNNNNVDAGMWNEISSDVTVRNYSAPRPVSYPTVTVLIHVSPEENGEDQDEDEDEDEDDDDDHDDDDGEYSEDEYSDDEDREFEDLDDEETDSKAKKHVHVGLLQLKGRKIITTVEGIKKKHNKILKDLMEQSSCNGRLVNDPQFGKVIELFGDQRRTVSSFLVQEGIVKKKHVKIHGF